MSTRKYIGVDIGGTSIVAARISEDELIDQLVSIFLGGLLVNETNQS